MDARLPTAVVRWLLLASVALGVVVMHHMTIDDEAAADIHTASASPMPGPPMGQAPAPDPDPGHDALHLCMAVVQQAGPAMIVLLLLLVGVAALVTSGRPRLGTAARRPPARPPPGLAGRALLHSVCVARL